MSFANNRDFATNNFSFLFSANKKLPKSFKELLSSYNPRPSNMIFARLYITDGRPILDVVNGLRKISSDNWRREMAFNSVELMALIVRDGALGSDQSFLELFDSIEKQYSSDVRRSRWAILPSSRNIEKKTTKVFLNLKPLLIQLEDNFIDWALINREKVHDFMTRLRKNLHN